MARRKKFHEPKNSSTRSRADVDLSVVLNSVAFQCLAVAGWLSSLRDEVSEYGGSEAIADLVASAEILRAACDGYAAVGFELMVSMPKGMTHEDAHEWAEELVNEREANRQDDDFPF